VETITGEKNAPKRFTVIITYILSAFDIVGIPGGKKSTYTAENHIKNVHRQSDKMLTF